jgi:hypothetical protein
VRHTLRSNDLLHLEVSRGEVFQSDLKIGVDMTAGGARDIIAEIKWSRS